ncbi:BclA C-terminal domain-containing protein, partial [Gottfriedia acidiceleris]|uniref:BclA C-terminal domain-containing protein n=1 Tax=Gottfriedia acidiceleris TaxID=371036 RepID=UPI003D20A597
MDEMEAEEPEMEVVTMDEIVAEEPEMEAASVDEMEAEEPEIEIATIDEMEVEEPEMEAATMDEMVTEEPKMEAASVDEMEAEEPEVEAATMDEIVAEEPEMEAASVDEMEAATMDEMEVEELEMEAATMNEMEAEEPEIVTMYGIVVEEPEMEATIIDTTLNNIIPIKLPLKQKLSGITVNNENNIFTINTAGTYYVTYQCQITSENQNANSSLMNLTTNSELYNNEIVTLSAGTQLQLQLESLEDIADSITYTTKSTLTIIRLA